MPILSLSGLSLSGAISVEKRIFGPAYSLSSMAKVSSVGKSFGFAMNSDGTQTIVGAYGSAQAFIYNYDGTTWALATTFTRSGRFGFKVAISDTWGAITDTPATGDGSVYLYRKTGNTWATTPFATITNPDTTLGSGFASAVSLSGTTLVVGHSAASSNGGAHVYVFNGTSWVKQGGLYTVAPSSIRANGSQRLGTEVSVDANTMIVGGSGDIIGRGFGMAFVSKRTGSTWSTPVVMIPSTTYADGYGWSVKVRGTKLLVGAPFGNATDAIPGRVFLYDYSTATPTLEQTFTVKTDKSQILSDPLVTTNDSFGWAVDISPDFTKIIVGAINRNSNKGAVYVYEKANNVWGPTALPSGSRLDPPDVVTNGRFGSSTVFAQNGVLVGSYGANAFYWFK